MSQEFEYEFCKKHNAPLTQIAGETFCMHDWLQDLIGHKVVDVAMPVQDDEPKDQYIRLVLDNHIVLPVMDFLANPRKFDDHPDNLPTLTLIGFTVTPEYEHVLFIFSTSTAADLTVFANANMMYVYNEFSLYHFDRLT